MTISEILALVSQVTKTADDWFGHHEAGKTMLAEAQKHFQKAGTADTHVALPPQPELPLAPRKPRTRKPRK